MSESHADMIRAAAAAERAGLRGPDVARVREYVAAILAVKIPLTEYSSRVEAIRNECVARIEKVVQP